MKSTSFPKLYKINNNGKVQEWNIWVDGKTIHTLFGLTDGKQQHLEEKISAGKNIGRSNETSPHQQAVAEAQSRWNKQKDRKGYSLSVEECESDVRVKPMLALDYQDHKRKVEWEKRNIFIQPKLDGMRMLVWREGNTMIAMSRQQKPITTVPHILKELRPVLPEGTILDGELYCHQELTFQQIMSAAKKQSLLSLKLKYHVYDLVAPGPFGLRYQALMQYVNRLEHTKCVETLPIFKRKFVDEWQQKFVEAGYEGAILRHGDAGYESGKRSSSLLKVKTFQDMEFEIIGVREGRGKFKGTAIFECETPDDEHFEVAAPGTMTQRQMFWKNRRKVIGSMLTVKFFEWSDDGIPRFPVAKAIRED